jgi:hypothetical protein
MLDLKTRVDSVLRNMWKQKEHLGDGKKIELFDTLDAESSISEVKGAHSHVLHSPSQSCVQLQGCKNFEAERRMLQEILIDAIECWRAISAIETRGTCVTSSRERLYREANFWIFGEYNNAPFFSFAHTCDSLGLNPDYIRRRLLEWRHVSAGSPSAQRDEMVARRSTGGHEDMSEFTPIGVK